MRGDVLTFKFSFPIGLLCWVDSFVLRNPARTQSVGTLGEMIKPQVFITMPNKYYFFQLELALRDPKDMHIYAYENLSHIPTKKLVEIFKIDLKKDPNILEGYFLTKSAYRKHKKYLDKELVPLNFDVFEYCLRQYVSDNYSSIRKLYKKSLME